METEVTADRTGDLAFLHAKDCRANALRVLGLGHRTEITTLRRSQAVRRILLCQCFERLAGSNARQHFVGNGFGTCVTQAIQKWKFPKQHALVQVGKRWTMK